MNNKKEFEKCIMQFKNIVIVTVYCRILYILQSSYLSLYIFRRNLIKKFLVKKCIIKYKNIVTTNVYYTIWNIHLATVFSAIIHIVRLVDFPLALIRNKEPK